jgi:hypothetical protein
MPENPERHPRTASKAEQECRWLEENREAIASINAFIERHGLSADRLRYRPGHPAAKPQGAKAAKPPCPRVDRGFK